MGSVNSNFFESRYCAIQANSDGRPCGWGVSDDREVAIAEAKNQYTKHRPCYLGERKGKLSLFEWQHDAWVAVSIRQTKASKRRKK